MNITISILAGAVIVLGYIVLNLLFKVIKLEKAVDKYDGLMNNISDLILESDSIFGDSNIRNGFESDDEVGGFFRNMKEMQSKLMKFTL